MIHIYYGDGKGKTSAAIGLAVRAAGRGMDVVIARFLKNEDSGEVATLSKIENITVLPTVKDFGFITSKEQLERIRPEAAVLNNELLESAFSKAQDVLVLDEICATLNFGFVDKDRFCKLLKERRDYLEIVLTGRDPIPEILTIADYASEIKFVRHPYEKGVDARIGIEY